MIFLRDTKSPRNLDLEFPWYADLVPLCIGEGPGPGCLDPDGAWAQVHVDIQGASHQFQAKVIHLQDRLNMKVFQMLLQTFPLRRILKICFCSTFFKE